MKNGRPPLGYKSTKHPASKGGRKQKRKSTTESAASAVVESATDQLKKIISLMDKHKPAITFTGVDSSPQYFPDDVVVDSMNPGYPSQRPFSSGMEIFWVHYGVSDTANSPANPTLKNCILCDDSAILFGTLQHEKSSVVGPEGTSVPRPRGKVLVFLIIPTGKSSSEDGEDDDDDGNKYDVSEDMLSDNQNMSKNESQQQDKSSSGVQESQS
jgi:hypothetical protein